MNLIVSMPVLERRILIEEAAERLQVKPVIVEKDFWVCWMLAVLFGRQDWNGALVFKGGTALSKVFGIIHRFSEDIDLSVSPAALGISEADVNAAESRRQRDRWMENLETACSQWVAERLQTDLEREISGVIGPRPGGQCWLVFQVDAATHSPVLLFHYPSVLTAGTDYIQRWVKLEFGSLTDQRPVGRHRVRPWLADILPAPLSGMGCDVTAIEAERAFWEKATILHAEHHRDPATPMPGNYSRHYADVAAMAYRPEAGRALADAALRERVVDWKSRFFARSWARYDLAKPGTFRLVPPGFRLAELEKDYRAMRPMFLVEPPTFASVIGTVAGLEKRINQTA